MCGAETDGATDGGSSRGNETTNIVIAHCRPSALSTDSDPVVSHLANRLIGACLVFVPPCYDPRPCNIAPN